MSDVLNHYQFSKEVLNRLPKNHPLLDPIRKHYDAYRLGSQGPDFLYYNALNKNSMKAGRLLHTEKIDEFFLKSLEFLTEHPEYRDQGLAYLSGYITHFELDRATHPFIFYRTGYNKSDEKNYSYLHKYYEVLLDTAMMQYEYSTQAVFSSPQKAFTISGETEDFLGVFYPYILKELYDIDLTPKDVVRGVKIAKYLLRYSTDAFGRKKKLARFLSKPFKNSLFINRLLYPIYTNEFEILNICRDPWKDPLTGEEQLESYPELYYQAIGDSISCLEKFSDLSFEDRPEPEEVSALFKDTSFFTGRAASEGSDLLYTDEEFKKRLIEYSEN